MYCRHCGAQIPDNVRFCPTCGQPTDAGNAGTAGNAQNGFEQQWNDLGGGIKDAAKDLKDGFNNVGNEWEATGEEFRQNRRDFEQNVHSAGARAEEAAEDLKKNWRDYLTAENIELFAACGLIFPFAMDVVRFVVSLVFGIISPLAGLGNIILILLKVIFVVCSVLAVGAGISTVAMNKEKQTVWGWVALGGDVLAFLAILGHVFHWRTIADVLLVITLLYGIDLIARVLVRKVGIESTPSVGEDLASYKQFYDDYKAAHPSEFQSEDDRIANDPYASYFDGTGWSNLGYSLLIALVGGITCGIATPWMLCKKYRWEKEHTVINGRRLAFNGTGASLLGHWILWELLTIVTCGIYSFFMYVALKRWEMKHTYYADEPLMLQEGTHSNFDGNSFQFFGYGLLAELLTLVTCCIGLPWALNLIQKWETKHEIICGDHMRYDGSALGLFMQSILAILLSIITCGIYTPWAEVRILKYVYKNYRVASQAEAAHDAYYDDEI